MISTNKDTLLALNMCKNKLNSASDQNVDREENYSIVQFINIIIGGKSKNLEDF